MFVFLGGGAGGGGGENRVPKRRKFTTAPYPGRNPNVFQEKSGRRILAVQARRNSSPIPLPSAAPSLWGRRIFWKVLVLAPPARARARQMSSLIMLIIVCRPIVSKCIH